MKQSLPIADLLTFKESDRTVSLDAVEEEFRLMKQCLKKPFAADIADRICAKSGSHLLKMVNPRVSTDHACLYFEIPGADRCPKILPSVNAADIPFCKVLFRPIRIEGGSSRSVIDSIINPDDSSEAFLLAFTKVFGKEVVDAVRTSLLQKARSVTKLAAGEFPIIFVPRADRSDLQITPVSPATAYMGVKSIISALYNTKKLNKSSLPYRPFQESEISSKPQNISGAIGGPRKRIKATMPTVMEQTQAEIYRFAHGKSFPIWRDPDVARLVLRYADMLENDKIYNDSNTRRALNNAADKLLSAASDFIDEILAEVRHLANKERLKLTDIPKPPNPAYVLIHLRSPKDGREKARRALTSTHFEYRMVNLENKAST